MPSFRPRRTTAPLSASTSSRRPSARSRAIDDRHCAGNAAACWMTRSTASAGSGTPFPQRNGRDLLACGGEEQAALGAREERTNARARERRHATDAGDEKELLPQHAMDVGRDLVRNAALLECAGD